MGANITIYCLEQLTDYFEFENLCSDLMAREGYSFIEPLAYFNDKGRDAIHVNRSTGETTIFAYSVREDWQAKLYEDADKIRNHNHDCQQLVFLTTERFSAGERDSAVKKVRDEYGWDLDLFGLERLRVLLDSNHPDLKHKHPHIFPPAFLLADAELEKDNNRNTLVILSDKSDKVFTEWLVRKLTSEKYIVWHENFQTLTQEEYLDDAEKVLQDDAVAIVVVVSEDSLNNPELTRLRSIAYQLRSDRGGDFLIPVLVEAIRPEQLDSRSRNLKSISFVDNWAQGLQSLLKLFADADYPKSLQEGLMVAARSFFEHKNVVEEAEVIVSNCLLIKQIPKYIMLFKSDRDIYFSTQKRWKNLWAFRSLGKTTFLSFQDPPSEVTDEFQLESLDSFSWTQDNQIHGVNTRNLVSELIAKALEVYCYEKGLKYYDNARYYYFPEGLIKKDRLSFTRPDGGKTSISVCGERKLFRPNNRSFRYKYHLAPYFRVRQDYFGEFVALLRVSVVFHQLNGSSFDGSRIQSIRKHLTKDWWNKEWLHRTLAISQFLGEEGQMVIGGQDQQIIISSEPLRFEAPYGIKEQ